MVTLEDLCTPGERLGVSVSFQIIFSISLSISLLFPMFHSPISHPYTAITPLTSQSDHESGQGTHIKGPYICASVVGIKRTLPPTADGQTHPRIEVICSGTQPVFPSIADVVIARVITINPRLATVDILAVGDTPVPHRCSGVVRIQDVRATEIDKVQLHLCFRPGDLIRAEVLSLGDARSYFLSTAKNELGVVGARSLSGEMMVPISWQEMQCPKSKIVEKRKVAKIESSI